VTDAYTAATGAAGEWAGVSAPDRGGLLTHAAELVEQRAELIANTLALEEGKAIRDARDEVRRAAAILGGYGRDCRHPVGELLPGRRAETLRQTVHEPLGVVCAITPWNLSIAIPAGKLAAALACGNTVIWNPAAVASGTAALLTAALADAGLPAGVMNLVPGTGDGLHDALLDGQGLRGVTFTGPAEIGRRLARRAAERGVRMRTDDGGMNLGVVLADADLDRAARSIVRSAMRAAGQRCTATRRAIVVDAVFDEVAERLIESASRLRVGDPLDERTDVGPMASAARFRAMTEYFDMAARQGVVAACGGTASDPAKGYFVPPTVYVDVDPACRLAAENTFGPVLTVVRAADTDDAMRLANATGRGQTGYVFTRDLASGLRCAGTLDAGVVYLNRESAPRPEVLRPTASRFFVKTKAVYIDGV
jgi:aldehyde dehydrogenase (NAD+)